MTTNSVDEILKTKKQLTVNSTVNCNKDINNTVNSPIVDEKYQELEDKTNSYLDELRGNPEFVADKLSRDLDDQKSIRYYRLLAINTDPEKLLEALSYVKAAERENRIRSKKAIYFTAILKKWGIKTKFKN
jgi:hypothetical protein